MTAYEVIYEQAQDGNWSARAVGLPVYSSGSTREEAEREIREAIALLRDEMTQAGEAMPLPESSVGVVTV
jgi:predicted RNase H-like HicB family nuclease